MKLEKLNTVVTGGSQGLGKAICEHFIREGANVMFCAREEAALQSALAQLRGMAAGGQQVFANTCDVSREADVEELFADARAKFGAVDVLVNNAGVYGPMGATESVPVTEWMRAVEINLLGVLLPSRAVIPRMKKSGRGKIIVVSGGGATNPMPNISSYAASKAGAVRLMETLAEELRAFHIDVNAIAPGALATRLVDQVLEAGPDKVGQAYFEKNKQWKENGATPLDKGASLAVYLASRESDGITGKLISAQWDAWPSLHERREELAGSDIYCLRRIVPGDRGKTWE